MSFTKKITWLTLFSVAMGFMETAIVIYLRKIYYPQGFCFPLIPVEPDIALVEFLREAATIIMLLGIGLLAGKTASQKFSFFIYCFAIWDLVYYLFLKIFLNWPGAWSAWDILFLIPVPWVGPVWAPCVVAITMILFAVVINYKVEKGYEARIRGTEWMLFIVGSLVIIASFITPYMSYLKQKGASAWTLNSSRELFDEIRQFVPDAYNWMLFVMGEVILLAGLALYAGRALSSNKRMISSFK